MTQPSPHNVVRKNGEIVTKALRYFLGRQTAFEDIVHYIARTENRHPDDIASTVHEVLEKGVRNGFIGKSGDRYFYDLTVPIIRNPVNPRNIATPIRVQSLEMLPNSNQDTDNNPNWYDGRDLYAWEYEDVEDGENSIDGNQLQVPPETPRNNLPERLPKNSDKPVFEPTPGPSRRNTQTARSSYYDAIMQEENVSPQRARGQNKRPSTSKTSETAKNGRSQMRAGLVPLPAPGSKRLSAALVDELANKYVNSKPKRQIRGRRSQPAGRRRAIGSRRGQASKPTPVPSDRVLRSHIRKMAAKRARGQQEQDEEEENNDLN